MCLEIEIYKLLHIYRRQILCYEANGTEDNIKTEIYVVIWEVADLIGVS
jgi:hypothetical protein